MAISQCILPFAFVIGWHGVLSPAHELSSSEPQFCNVSIVPAIVISDRLAETLYDRLSCIEPGLTCLWTVGLELDPFGGDDCSTPVAACLIWLHALDFDVGWGMQVIHQCVAFGLFTLPVYFMWEKAIGEPTMLEKLPRSCLQQNNSSDCAVLLSALSGLEACCLARQQVLNELDMMRCTHQQNIGCCCRHTYKAILDSPAIQDPCCPRHLVLCVAGPFLLAAEQVSSPSVTVQV